MHIVIWGAGGIGCYYGARFLQAGHQVSFIARGEHLHALQRDGLTLAHERFPFQGDLNAYSAEQFTQTYSCDQVDLVIVCLKNTATESFIVQHKEWLKQGSCLVMSLQNGVDNEPMLAALLGEGRVLGGLAVRIGGHILEPGKVEARGVAQIVFGAWPDSRHAKLDDKYLQELEREFSAAEIDATLSTDIRYELWRKLLINNGVNPLSALSGLDTRSLTSHPQLGTAVYQMMEETAAAAQSEGVDIQQRDVDEMFQLISQFDAIKTSMLVDREKGRPLELDGICGSVVRRLEASGKKAPLTSLVMALLSLQTEHSV